MENYRMRSNPGTTLTLTAIAFAAQLAILTPSQAEAKRVVSMRRSPQAIPAENAQSAAKAKLPEFQESPRSTTWLGLLVVGNMSAINIGSTGASASSAREANDLLGRGFAPGLMLDLNADINRFIALDTSAGFLQRRQKIDLGTDAFDTSLTTSWIVLAPLIRVKFAGVLSVGVGPYAAYRVSDYRVRASANDGSAEANGTATTDAKSFDAGGVGAFGARIPLGSNLELLADARYTLGLVNQVSNTQEGGSLKYNDIQFLLGLSFGL